MKNLTNYTGSKFDKNNQISFDLKMHKKHSKELGLHTPKDYFSKSKIEILENTSNKREIKVTIFSRERLIWSVAATITLIFILTVFKPNALPSINEVPAIVSDTINLLKHTNIAQVTPEENTILISSLFVSDDEIDEFVANYVLEQLVYEEVLSN
tara:strand:- start:37439 stop:37903 length:465 start_codon:yes stop_codon:yes gene_type:complete